MNETARSSVCVDASLALQWLLPAPQSEPAARLLADWRRTDTLLVAPALIAFEVTSALRRLVHLDALTDDEGAEALAAFQQLGVRLSHRRDIFPLAWRMAREFAQPRAYDMAYVALAHILACELWTADRRLVNAVGGKLPWVRWVGDISE